MQKLTNKHSIHGIVEKATYCYGMAIVEMGRCSALVVLPCKAYMATAADHPRLFLTRAPPAESMCEPDTAQTRLRHPLILEA